MILGKFNFHYRLENRRRAIFFFFIWCVLALVSGLVGYEFGYTKAEARSKTSQKVIFLMTLVEMEKLRKGDSSEVLSMLEKRCYSYALDVLIMSKKDGEDAVIASTVQKLINYRRNYSKPEADWSPTERHLDEQLKLWESLHN